MGSYVPAWLQGGWRRNGRSIGGQPMEEVSDVWWLQAGAYFADLRRPISDGAGTAPSVLDVAQAFSGRVCTKGSTVTWSHDLDSLGRPAGYEDSAEIRRDSGQLVECGPDYVERWHLEVPAENCAVLERRHPATRQLTARIVMIGELTLAVWSGRETGGATLRFDAASGGWNIDAEVGTGTIPWPAVVAARSNRPAPGWLLVA